MQPFIWGNGKLTARKLGSSAGGSAAEVPTDIADAIAQEQAACAISTANAVANATANAEASCVTSTATAVADAIAAEQAACTVSTATAISDATAAAEAACVISTAAAVSAALANAGASSSGWQRPADWLDMPEVNVGDEIVCMLVAVFDNDTNYIAVKVRNSAYIDLGNGNGNIPLIDNVSTEFQLEYSDYVGTETSAGYRQALVVITPQSGQSLTSIDIEEVTPSGGHDANTAIIETKQALPNAARFQLIGTSLPFALESVEYIGPANNLATFSNQLKDLKRLMNYVHPTGLLLNGLYAMYQNANALRNPPLIDTSITTDFRLLHADNYNLQIPLEYDTSSGLNFSGMYNGAGLIEPPVHDLSSATDVSSYLQETLIQYIPTYSLNNVTTVSNFAYKIPCLLYIAPQSLPVCTNIFGFARDSTLVREITLTNLGLVDNTGYAFSNCDSLSKLILQGLTIGFDIHYSNMGTQALNDLFDSLGTANGAQTITITSNPGALTCDTSIATLKGWTVVTGA